MNNIVKIILVIFVWLFFQFVLYLALDPIKEDLRLPTKYDEINDRLVHEKVVNEETFKSFLIWNIILTLISIVILTFMMIAEKILPFVRRVDVVIENLSRTEKVLLHVPMIQYFVPEIAIPLDKESKKVLIRYECIYDNCKYGGIHWSRLNCMSDLRSSATDIRRDSPVEGFCLSQLSINSAKQLLGANLKGGLAEELVSLDKKLREKLEGSGESRELFKKVLLEESEAEKRRSEDGNYEEDG